MMKRIFHILPAVLALAVSAAAQRPPLYIVNGRPADDLRAVDPEDIVSTELLPADERTVELYGERANDGVIVVTLRYDAPARFDADTVSFQHYIAERVKWGDTERTARFVMRFTVAADGSVVPGREIESTDPRLRRKVLRAVAEAPRWTPAAKDGQPVESSHVLRIQLPEGREMPSEPAVILL